MMQFVIIAAVIAVVYFLYFKKKPIQTTVQPKPKAKKEEANEMIECASCGVYCELGDAILSNAKYYCSDECVQKGK